MTDTIKAFLEADAKRTQGGWNHRFNKSNTQLIIEADSQIKHPQAKVATVDWWTSNEGCPNLKDAEANAIFIALCSTLAPAIRTMLSDIESARKVLEICYSATKHCSNQSTQDAWNATREALAALEKHKGET